MGSPNLEERQSARVTVSAKVEFVPGVTSFAREIASKLGLPDNEAKRLELVVEEACMNVVEHAFDPGEKGAFDVIIWREPTQVVVAVEDQGLPFDFRRFEDGKDSGLGVILMKAFADEVRFVNLGRRGKRVELIKKIPVDEVEAREAMKEVQQQAPAVPLAPTDAPLLIRLASPEDCIGIARCVYRCYGYTYPKDYVYSPERLREQLDNGMIVSAVALDTEGEVVAHTAILKDSPTAVIGDAGLSIVDPRYRNRGLLSKVGRVLLDHVRQQGLRGVFGEAVTVHTFSQQAALAAGSRETGILLGFVPQEMQFRKIQDKQDERQAAVLSYMKLNDGPQRDVYPPLHHETIIRRIYERLNLERTVISARDLAQEKVKLGKAAQVDLKVLASAGCAGMTVTEYGEDLLDLVKFRLRELCLQQVSYIYLDLPLSHPAVTLYCAGLEMMGFFFAGVIPEAIDGDALRLQYLNNVRITPSKAALASDWGKELMEYVTGAGGFQVS